MNAYVTAAQGASAFDSADSRREVLSISGVLLDAGEVLYTRPRRAQQIRDYLTRLDLSDQLDSAQLQVARELKTASWLGTVSASDYHAGILELYGVEDDDDLAHGDAVWVEMWPDIELFPGVVDTLYELHARGLKLGVVTNTLNRTEEKLGWFRERGMKSELWDAFATSCELGMIKPHPDIYQHALNQFGLLPEQVVFVGHAQDEIDGAAALGMPTIAFNRDDESVSADVVIEEFDSLVDSVDLLPTAPIR